jgi:hypothetical protein
MGSLARHEGNKDVRNTSREGMNFEYNYNGQPNMAYFGYGNRSLVFEYPSSEWRRFSEKEKETWRKAKYAEAMRILGVHYGRV